MLLRRLARWSIRRARCCARANTSLRTPRTCRPSSSAFRRHGARLSSSSFETASGASKRTASRFPKLKVVLDIDECLVHSMFGDEAEARQYEYRPDRVERCNQFELRMEDNVSVRVNRRPGLDEFLKIAFEEFDVYTFTAAMPVYARPLIAVLDPELKVKGRFYREDCTFQDGLYLKDLTKIDSDLSRIVLVDNNPTSFLLQPDNGIPVAEFFDNPKDDQLARLLPVLRMLANDSEDVREPLADIFGLRRRFESIMKPDDGEGEVKS